MRMSRFGIVLIVLLGFLTWRHWDLFSSSVVSLAGFLVLVGRDPGAASRLWNDGLLEYWVALIVWCAAIGWITSVLLRSRTRLEPRGPDTLEFFPGRIRSAVILAIVIFVALTSPLIAPVAPNIQGALGSTRLLPPFSEGFISHSTFSSPERDDSGDRVETAFRNAADRLLQRSTLLTGKGNPENSRDGTSMDSSGFTFVLGTDDVGRDVLSRVLYGTRVSLGIGLAAAFCSLLIGTCVGLVAGLSGRVGEAVSMRCTDLMLAIPGLFIVIGLTAFLGHSISTLVLVLGLTGWMGIARLVRGELLALREKEFVLAAKLLMVPGRKIIATHLLPHLSPILVTAGVLQFSNAVLAETALGFLGLGVQPPTASWGNMMGEASGYLERGWWVGFFPGLFLAIVVVSAHYLGEKSPVRKGISGEQQW